MPSSSPASIIDSSRLSQRLKTSRNFSILRSCSHVARFIDSPPTRRHRTGQLVCYLSRTTHELTTLRRRRCREPFRDMVYSAVYQKNRKRGITSDFNTLVEIYGFPPRVLTIEPCGWTYASQRRKHA